MLENQQLISVQTKVHAAERRLIRGAVRAAGHLKKGQSVAVAALAGSVAALFGRALAEVGDADPEVSEALGLAIQKADAVSDAAAAGASNVASLYAELLRFAFDTHASLGEIRGTNTPENHHYLEKALQILNLQ